jgi:hypothetical protein
MPLYAVGGHEEYPVLHLRPVEEEPGVQLPESLYLRWQRARAELDAVQRDVLSHIRGTAGGGALPPSLREAQDYPALEDPADRSWNLS